MSGVTEFEKLRLYLGERVPTNGTPSDTFFSDDELQTLMDSSQYGIFGAAVLGWAAKAGEYARLIDMNESGGDRRLSQKYRQALSQMQWFQTLTDKQLASITSAGRVAGKSIDVAGTNGGKPGLVMYTKRYNRMPVLDVAAVINADQIVEYNESLFDQPGQ